MSEDHGQAGRAMKPLVAEDLYAYAWVSDPQLSPCGQRLAYLLTRPEHQGKKYTAEIWLRSVTPDAAAGGGGERVTKGGKRFSAGPRDRAPRWSPDGRQLAFISDRGDGAQIWLIAAGGGEATQLTRLKGGVAGEPVWSPDGLSLAFLHREDGPGDGSGPDPAISPAPDAAATATVEPKSDVRVYSRLKYKENGRGLWDGKHQHVYVIAAAGGEPVRVTSGPYDDAAPAWSPDSQMLAFTANRTPDPDRTPVADVFVVPAAGGEPRRVTVSTGPCAQPAWSPDGREIAYFGHRGQFRGATEAHVFVVPADGTVEPYDAMATWDGSLGLSAGSDIMASSMPAPAWTPDGRSVLFLATEAGAVNIYSVPVTGGGPAVSQLTCGQQAIYAASFNASRTAAAVALATQTNPGDIYFYAALAATTPGGTVPCPSSDAAGPRRLTNVNAWLEERTVVQPEEFWCTGPDGGRIHGWLAKPASFQTGQRYPLVVEIHGGPHTAYGWAYFHEFQVLAGRGFGVMFCNPAGSTSYGQEFVTLTHHDWGGRDYRDVMAATEYAAAQPWVDSERLGVTGGSYGGYLTNWIIGQTGRFRAAVTQRSTSNRYSMFGTSDIGYYNGDYEFRGNPWDEPAFYLERSPITYIERVRTPLLLIHSENDLRCPIEQGEQLYTALRWLGKTAELVRFPDENHELSRSGQPIHRVERIRRLADWFTKYLGHSERQ